VIAGESADFERTVMAGAVLAQGSVQCSGATVNGTVIAQSVDCSGVIAGESADFERTVMAGAVLSQGNIHGLSASLTQTVSAASVLAGSAYLDTASISNLVLSNVDSSVVPKINEEYTVGSPQFRFNSVYARQVGGTVYPTDLVCTNDLRLAYNTLRASTNTEGGVTFERIGTNASNVMRLGTTVRPWTEVNALQVSTVNSSSTVGDALDRWGACCARATLGRVEFNISGTTLRVKTTCNLYFDGDFLPGQVPAAAITNAFVRMQVYDYSTFEYVARKDRTLTPVAGLTPPAYSYTQTVFDTFTSRNAEDVVRIVVYFTLTMGTTTSSYYAVSRTINGGFTTDSQYLLFG
jgi:hypothetical protein